MDCAELHRDPSKRSLLKYIINRTGSEQCWAPVYVKPQGVFLAGDGGELHSDLSNGSLVEHILNDTGPEQCWALMSVNHRRTSCWHGWGLAP